MIREPGTTCGIGPYTWHGGDLAEPPGVGDFLRTRAGSCYRIDSARTVGGDRHRFMFRVTRLERDAVQPGQPGVFDLYWNPR